MSTLCWFLYCLLVFVLYLSCLIVHEIDNEKYYMLYFETCLQKMQQQKMVFHFYFRILNV